MEFDDDISQSLAAELTGTTGFSDDDLDNDQGMLPHDVVDDLEAFDDQVARRDAHLQPDYEPGQQPVPSEALQQQRQQLDEQLSLIHI